MNQAQEKGKAKYRIRFFYEYSSPSCLWAADESTNKKYGYRINPIDLPLSKHSLELIDRLCNCFDTSLNWNSPSDPGPWTAEETNRFNQASEQLFKTIKFELGVDYELINEQSI